MSVSGSASGHLHYGIDPGPFGGAARGDFPIDKTVRGCLGHYLFGGILISLIASIVAIVLPALLVAVVLYWIIRLGVKHGMRAYYAEKIRESETL
jgi:hypothetical protein